MADIRERPTKSERLEVRLSPATRSLLAQAARLRHTTLTEFLISSAVKAAEDAMIQPRLFEIETDAGWGVLTRVVDRPENAAPDAALVALPRENQPEDG